MYYWSLVIHVTILNISKLKKKCWWKYMWCNPYFFNKKTIAVFESFSFSNAQRATGWYEHEHRSPMLEVKYFHFHMTGCQLLSRSWLQCCGQCQPGSRWDWFVSFEKLSVNNFHGWSVRDYQNIYLNCHNIL